MAIFLGENGELAMGNKTPVTILQETLQRSKLTPHYELIYNGVGTNDPLFEFRVSADGLSAEGSGKSKKEAKHNAARAFLRRMKPGNALVENANVEVVEGMNVASPYSGALKENFIGMLEGICVVNKLPFPIYILISEIGPPHARVFTIKCKMSSCTETAIARTKKQAKHLAAKQMVERVKAILGDKYVPYVEKMNMDPSTLEDLDGSSNMKAIESHHHQPNLALELCNLHNVFHLQEDVLPQTFTDLPSNDINSYENNSYDKLNEVVQELGGTCRIVVEHVVVSEELINTALSDVHSEHLGLEIEDDNCENGITDSDVGVVPSPERATPEPVDLGASSTSGPASLSEFVDNMSLLGIDVLDLEDSDEDTTIPQADSKKNDSEDTFDACENFKKLEIQAEDSSSEVSELRLFIIVECPQGVWSFFGIDKTYEKALKKASIKGLQFLRIMAIPPTKR